MRANTRRFAEHSGVGFELNLRLLAGDVQLRTPIADAIDQTPIDIGQRFGEFRLLRRSATIDPQFPVGRAYDVKLRWRAEHVAASRYIELQRLRAKLHLSAPLRSARQALEQGVSILAVQLSKIGLPLRCNGNAVVAGSQLNGDWSTECHRIDVFRTHATLGELQFALDL